MYVCGHCVCTDVYNNSSNTANRIIPHFVFSPVDNYYLLCESKTK